jgi:hypothetical protein
MTVTLDLVLATMLAYARRVGFDPRHADLEQCCTAWLLVDIVREHVDGQRHDAGRRMARDRLRQYAPQLAIEATLDALDQVAFGIATPEFVERVRELAGSVH